MTSIKPGCSACAGREPVTPQSVANPLGQQTLHYRVGTHSAFMETMQARLSTFPTLAGLTARDTVDASIAVLDAWACVADILSFYQERIANEGYLRTATERYSLGEIGRLVGYKPRPGVAASAFLAYTLDTGYQAVIPTGTRAQSLPGQNQLPQTFETSEAIEARAEWNHLTPRRFRPQRLDEGNAFYVGALHFEGTASRLNAGDPLLLVWGKADKEQVLRRVASVEMNAERGTTRVRLVTHLTLAQFFAAMQDMRERVLPEFLNTASFAQADTGWQHDLHELNDLIAELLRIGPNARGDDAAESARRRYLQKLAQLDAERKNDVAQAPPKRDDLIDELIRLFKSLDPAFRAGRTFNADQEFDRFFKGATTPPSDKQDTMLLLSQKIAPGTRRFTSKTRTQKAAPTEAASRLLTRFANSDSGAFFHAFAQIGGPRHPTSDAPEETPTLRPAQVLALRTTASLFGHNAPPRVRVGESGAVTPINDNLIPLEGDDANVVGQQTLFLEREYPELIAGDWAVIQTDPFRFRESLKAAHAARHDFVMDGDGLRPTGEDPDDVGLRYAVIQRIQNGISRSAYGTSGKTTVMTIAAPDNPATTLWWRRPLHSSLPNVDNPPQPVPDPDSKAEETVERLLAQAADNARFTDLRRTVVHSKSEPLVLANEPIAAPVEGDTLVLDTVYEGLTPGRRIIVAGERADLFGAKNVSAAEVVIIAGIDQTTDPYRPGDTLHTTLTLTHPLQCSYTRATALVYGNVVDATQGETRTETLGSGNASQSMQRFTLRQKPLTQVSAPTPSGIESSLHVYVDDVQWHQVEGLNEATPDARVYVTSSDETGEATLYFGDGQRGARLPTGQDNVRAVYRTGIGRAGNVGASAISQMVSRPLGVKSVVNPAAASGGAEPETANTMRQHIPLSLASLERLISQSDYAAFSRVFAGVGKASAARLATGRGGILQVTLAAVDDGPLDVSDDLMNHLKTALRRYGDPTVALSLRVREKIVPLVKAKIKLEPDFLWDKVAVAVQDALWAAFGFEQRDLAQTLFPAEVVRVMQSVPGVDYVDLDVFTSLSESDAADADKRNAFLDLLQGSSDPSPKITPLIARGDRIENRQARPAQIAYLDAALPETLILSQIL